MPPESAPNALAALLGATRTRLTRVDATRASLIGITALLLLALLVPLLVATFVTSRSAALAVASLTGLVGLLIIVIGAVVAFLVPRRRYREDAQVARWIGTQRPAVASDLLSCVEFQQAAPAHGQGLVQAHVARTWQELERESARSLVPTAPARASAWWCGLTATALVAVLLTHPETMARGWRKLTARTPPAPFGGALLSTQPLVGDLELMLHFPPYLGRAPQQVQGASGDLRAPRGTRIEVRGRALAPAIAARVQVEPTAGPVSLSPLRVTGSEPGSKIEGGFMVTSPGHYRFEFLRAAGRRTIEAVAHVIEIEPDRAPTVELIAPAPELDVTHLRRIELAYGADDDVALAKLELVWEGGAGTGRRPLPLPQPSRATVQGKLVWDLAEVALAAGAEAQVWVEATDNDAISGGNVGRSQPFTLRVFSTRERHEQALARQQATAERMLDVLAGRLELADGGLDIRVALHAASRDLTVELGTVAAGLAASEHASDQLRAVIDAMKARLEGLLGQEAKLLERAAARKAIPTPAAFLATDGKLIAELEDDVLALADWLERERLENALDVADEINAHKKRLTQLFADLRNATGDVRAKLEAELTRELAALDRLQATFAQRQAGLSEDVLDRFVHQDALAAKAHQRCSDRVRALLAAGKTTEAEAEFAVCAKDLEATAAQFEQALDGLRGDKFEAEQRPFEELQSEIADLRHDQAEIATEADRIFDAYATAADEVARDASRAHQRQLEGLIERIRRRLDDVPSNGLTPFASEELDVVHRRLDDVSRMIDDGDLAEAATMARQARGSLDAMAGELEASLDEDANGQFASETERALRETERATTATEALIEALDGLAPRPGELLSRDDRGALERLRRRQVMAEERATRLAERVRAAGPTLPGDAAEAMRPRLEQAAQRMGAAAKQMKAIDPGSARQEARAAAEALEKAERDGRGAARQQQQGGPAPGEQPIRIPGADDYRPPEQFREQLLEAMKQRAPDGYDEQVRRYYQELIK